MTVRVLSLPTRVAQGLHDNEVIENLAIGAWEPIALSLQELTAGLQQQITNPSDPADKAYMTREIVAVAVETIELLGSALLRFRDPHRRQFHYATNSELRSLFSTIEGTLTSQESAVFLRLPKPNGGDRLVAEAFTDIEERARLLLIDLAEYWLIQIPIVRWFRHLPACLAWNEPPLIDTSNSESLRETTSQLKKELPGLLEVIVHPDKQTFTYEPLGPNAGQIARGLMRTAIQLLYMISGNQLLDPESTNPEYRLPKLYPVLLYDMSAEKREALQRSGRYFFAT